MRPRFFVESAVVSPRSLGDDPPRQAFSLAPRDSHHAVTVLRARPGDPCEVVFAPSRAVAEAVFDEVADRVTVRATGWISVGAPQRVRLLLVQGLPQPRKLDEIVEKGTEVGVDSFLAVPAAGSPKTPIERVASRVDRWRTIAAEAAKQSKQLAVPDVHVADSLEAALAHVQSGNWRSVILDPPARDHLGAVLGRSSTQAGSGIYHCALWVGPEGGWSREEIAALTDSGCLPATMGSRVLRTETAGPVAAALARYALSDW